jgi:chemotaxis protein CheZ
MPNDRLPLQADSGDSRVHGLLPEDAAPNGEVHQHLGHLTRTLHEALRELGIDHALNGTRVQLPDARDRLSYIARTSGEAAERVLDGVDRARAVQKQMAARAADLHARWQASELAAAASPETRALIDATGAYFDAVGTQSEATGAILTDIMLAQDFHDLTGQVIRKVATLAQDMERQLVTLLRDTATPEQRARIEAETSAASHRTAGPVMRPEARTDIAASQADVDAFLDSLGF